MCAGRERELSSARDLWLWMYRTFSSRVLCPKGAKWGQGRLGARPSIQDSVWLEGLQGTQNEGVIRYLWAESYLGKGRKGENEEIGGEEKSQGSQNQYYRYTDIIGVF